MMKRRNIKAKITQYKLALVWVCTAFFALVGLIITYNFVFNPASSVHFTVYVPQQKSIYSNHLVVPGYGDALITIFGMQQAVFGYAIIGENTRVIQEKSTTELNCDGIEKCTTERTEKGQLYKYGYQHGTSGDIEQVAVLKKGNTKIVIIRDRTQELSSEEYGKLIDSLEPAPLGRPYIYDEHTWVLV